MQTLLLTFLATAVFVSGLHGEAPFSFEKTPGKLPKNVVPKLYDLHIAPDLEKRTFVGRETVELTIVNPTKVCVLNAANLKVADATLEPASGAAIKGSVELDKKLETCTVAFPSQLPAGDYRLSLHFTGKINADGAGLFFSTYENAEGKPETMLCTQMEPADARRLFPCWDEPAFRAKFRVSLEVPKSHAQLIAISNMPLESSKPTATGIEHIFQTTPPMASYLVMLALGNFAVVEGEADGVPIRIVAVKDRIKHGQYALEIARKLLHEYDEFFGVKYPLPKLDLLALSGGVSFDGGMENWGAIVFSETYLLYDPDNTSQSAKEQIFETIAHEMSHQWFGDLVTMGWWDNLWLNEGFAEWMGQSMTDKFNPDWGYWHEIQRNKETAMESDARSTTHPLQQPVADEMDANRAFDEITYNKGQAFIRTLENYLGADKFRDGLRLYMKAHAYGNTTTADLWAALSEADGQPVADIAALWTEQPGFPIVNATSDPGTADIVSLSQRRFTVHDAQAAPLAWKIPVTQETIGSSDRAHLKLTDTDSWKLSEANGGIQAAPSRSLLLEAQTTLPAPVNAALKLNVDGGGYYRVDYDPSLWQALLSVFDDLTPADQCNLLADYWAEVRAGISPAAGYFEIVKNLHPLATSDLVWLDVCSVVREVDAFYVGGNEQARVAWRAAMLWQLRPVFERCGWEARESDTVPARKLRAELISLFGFFDDASTVAECQRRFAAYSKDASALPPDIRAAACDVAGRHADTAVYERLLDLAQTSDSDEQQALFFDALGCASNPTLAHRSLELTLKDELPGDYATGLLDRVASAGEHPAWAAAFLLQHAQTIADKVGSGEKHVMIPDLYMNFDEATRADELEKYAKGNESIDATEVKKAAEEIRANAELKTGLLPQVQAWLHSFNQPATETLTFPKE